MNERLTDRETVGVVPLPHLWCAVHEELWASDEDECNAQVGALPIDDEPCFGIPLYVGMPDPDALARREHEDRNAAADGAEKIAAAMREAGARTFGEFVEMLNASEVEA